MYIDERSIIFSRMFILYFYIYIIAVFVMMTNILTTFLFNFLHRLGFSNKNRLKQIMKIHFQIFCKFILKTKINACKTNNVIY